MKMSFSVEQTSSCTLQRNGPALSTKFKRTGFSHTASHDRPPTHDPLFAAYLCPVKPAEKSRDAILKSPKWVLSKSVAERRDCIDENPPKYSFGKVRFPSGLHLTQSAHWVIQKPLWISCKQKESPQPEKGKTMWYPRHEGSPSKGKV